MDHYDDRDRKHEKELREQIEKQADPNQPNNVAKYQHQLAQNLLKEQHALNLEIHKKQADLALEIHERQSKLTIISIVVSAIIALSAVMLGFYLK